MNTIEASLTLLPLFLCSTSSQDYMQWGLPEGVKARLGKGTISDITYSPDGTRIAVASSIGIWLYDTNSHQAVALLTGKMSGADLCVTFNTDGTPELGTMNDRFPGIRVSFGM